MSKTKSLKRYEDSLASKTNNLLNNVAAATSSILIASKEEKTLMTGRVMQGIIQGRTREIVSAELRQLIDANKIKPSFFDTAQGQEGLRELVQFLDDPKLDEHRLEILKAILFASAREDKEHDSCVLSVFYMQIARSLSPLAAFAFLRITQTAIRTEHDVSTINKEEWLEATAKNAGLSSSELVAMADEELTSKHLFIPTFGSSSGVSINEDGRLSQLGKDLYSFVEIYQELKIEDEGVKKQSDG